MIQKVIELQAPPFHRDRFTWLAYGLLAYYAYLQAALGPLMPFLRAEFSLNYTVAGLHLSAFALGMIFSGVAGDRLARHWGRRGVLWLGALGMAAGTVLLVGGKQPLATVAGSLVMGMLGSLLLVMVQATLADHHGQRRSVALTEANVGAGAAGVLAPFAVGGLQQLGMGWRSALLLPVVLVSLAAGRLWREPVPDGRRREGDDSAGPSGRQALPLLFWAYWAVLLLVVASEWGVIFWGADFMESVVGLSKTAAATSMTVFWIAYLLGRVAGSWLARRVPAFFLLVLALLVSLAGFPLFWLAPIPLLNIAGLFLTGLGFANLFPLTLSVAVGVAADQANEVSARAALGGGLAILFAPLAMGSLADSVGLQRAFGVEALLVIAATVVAVAAARLAGSLARAAG